MGKVTTIGSRELRVNSDSLVDKLTDREELGHQLLSNADQAITNFRKYIGIEDIGTPVSTTQGTEYLIKSGIWTYIFNNLGKDAPENAVGHARLLLYADNEKIRLWDPMKGKIIEDKLSNFETYGYGNCETGTFHKPGDHYDIYLDEEHLGDAYNNLIGLKQKGLDCLVNCLLVATINACLTNHPFLKMEGVREYFGSFDQPDKKQVTVTNSREIPRETITVDHVNVNSEPITVGPGRIRRALRRLTKKYN